MVTPSSQEEMKSAEERYKKANDRIAELQRQFEVRLCMHIRCAASLPAYMMLFTRGICGRLIVYLSS